MVTSPVVRAVLTSATFTYLYIMKKYFKTENGEKVNIVEHTLEQIETFQNISIRIGTDSQDYSDSTYYVTTIVYRYGTRGAHYIYYKEKLPRIRDMYSRLFDEARRTIETAQLIDNEIPVAFEGLEFDYNNIPKFQSNRLVSSVRGWVLGLNYKPIFKGSLMIATRAADHIIRKS